MMNCEESELHKHLTPQEMSELAGRLILRKTGEDLSREGLEKTPVRFAKALDTILSGYNHTPEQIVGEGIFAAESRGIVSVNAIEFYSLCEHHLLPFWGLASVAYFPNEKIIGLSKIPRLVELFSRRVQVQERLTHQIGESLLEILDARAVIVRAKAQHLCMMMRGVEKQQSYTTTEAVFGEANLTEREKDSLYKMATH